MNILFWGSSQLSVPFLEALCSNELIKQITVVTLPDKPQGRGLRILPTPVKLLAEEKKLNIIVTENLKDIAFQEKIVQINPDLGIVVSYGKIIPVQVIKLHKIGMLNVHFSLLPKYRGAAPIQWTLLNGDEETGVTIFWLDEGMDTGDIFLQSKLKVSPEDDYFSLSEKLVNLGIEMLNEVLLQITNGKILRIPQSGEVSYAPIIKKEMAVIDWNKSAIDIHNLVRAFVNWPKATATLQTSLGKTIKVKILKTEVDHVEHYTSDLKVGTILNVSKNCFSVLCGNNSFLRILKLQPENRNVMTAGEFICGYHLRPNDRFI